MKKRNLLVLANPKGGNGKSHMGAMIIEWCNHVGVAVDMIDTDPGQTLRTWAKYCCEESRPVVQEGASLVVVDTAGTEGGCLPWLDKATLVVCPFRPNFADLDRLASWFLSFSSQVQRKFIFLPNAVGMAAKHQRGIASFAKLVSQQGHGKLFTDCIMKQRDAIYPDVLEGISQNFFTLGYRYKEAQRESAHVVQAVLRQLGIKAAKARKTSHGTKNKT